MAKVWRAWGLIVLLSASGGCSLLFQQRLSSKADPTVEPQCNDSSAWSSVDAIFTVGALIAAIYTIATDPPDRNLRVGLSIAEGTLFGISGGLGSAWAERCQRALKTWDAREEERKEVEARERDAEADLERRRARIARSGFYCTTSSEEPRAGFCTRDRMGCDQARAVVLTTVADMTACVRVEAAWCFDETHCAPTESVCDAQRTSDGLGCKETR